MSQSVDTADIKKMNDLVNKIPDEFRKDNFEISGRHYYWMTIDEMEKDDNIKKKNLDVVDFVKEYIK